MVHVQAIDARDAEVLHRLLLNLADDFQPLFTGRSSTRHIEDGTYFIFTDEGIEHRFVHLKTRLTIIIEHIDGQFRHLTYFLFQGHP